MRIFVTIISCVFFYFHIYFIQVSPQITHNVHVRITWAGTMWNCVTHLLWKVSYFCVYVIGFGEQVTRYPICICKMSERNTRMNEVKNKKKCRLVSSRSHRKRSRGTHEPCSWKILQHISKRIFDLFFSFSFVCKK